MPEEHKKDLAKIGQSSFGAFVLELIKIVVICLAIIIPVRFFLIQPFFVKGDSMEPNFSDKEYLIIDEISYRFSEPKRGEVIVFRYPKDPSQFYIKRIIGLPNETIEINDGQVIVYNDAHKKGVELKEYYLQHDERTPGISKTTLGEDEYFVLGDNRKASSDSRVWGALPQSFIIGRTWLRAFPINKASAFTVPTYRTIEN